MKGGRNIFVNRIGIDRSVIAGFRIIKIDYEKLQRNKNVIIDKEGIYTYLLNDGSSFRWLKIEDKNMFGVMCAGTKKGECVKKDYSRMDIVIQDNITGNLQNMSVEQYKERIRQIFSYLCERYGIYVDLSELKISEIEINCTFALKEEFYKYHRALRLLMYNLPNSFKKIGQVVGVNKEENRLEAETFYRGNASMEIKIYDKKKQLEQTRHFEIEENIMRIEMVLKTSQKVKEAFNSASVWELSEEVINSFFYKQIARLFVKPYKKWRIDNGKKLRNLICFHKDKSIRQWKSTLLNECSNIELTNQIPMLLDIRDLLSQVKQLDKAGHYSRVEKGILELCVDNDVYLQKDSDKVMEIFDSVQEAYDKYLFESVSETEIATTVSGDVA